MKKSYYFGNFKCTVEGEWPEGELGQFTGEIPYEHEIHARVTDEPVPEIGSSYSPDGYTAAAAYGDGWLLYNAPGVKNPDRALFVDKSYSTMKTMGYRENEPGYSAEALKKLRVAFDAAMPFHGGTILHSSCVRYQGFAVCFCGPSGMGKSTHARQWRQRFDAPMLSSDAPGVFPEEGGARAYGMPWDGSDHILSQDSLPIKAIVELRQRKKNSIRRLTRKQAFRMLMKQGHLPLWDEEGMFREILVLKRLSGSVPFYRLGCLPEESAAELVESVLFGENKNVTEEETEMRVKEGFVLRDVMDEHIVMPAGGNMKTFEGALVLSGTSAFVWEKLKDNVSRSELIEAVLSEYDVDRATAEKDIDSLIEKLKSYDVLEELD